MKNKLIYILFLICWGCENKKTPLFNQTKSIRCETIQNSPFFGLPISLINYRSCLYISDFYGDTLITTFDLSGIQKVKKIIKKGIGPEEAQPPVFISIAKNELIVFNKNKFLLSAYTLNENRLLLSKKQRETIQISTKVAQLCPINNGKYIASGYFDNGRYALLNDKGVIEKEFGQFPKFSKKEESIPKDAKAMFHQVQFSSMSNLNKIASLSNYILEIIDFSKDIYVSKSILLDKYDYEFTSGNVLSAKRTSETVRGAISITQTEKYIYVLFDYFKNKTTDRKTEIWVFDWEGNPIKKIQMDKKLVLITALNDNILYAITDQDFKIVKLKL